MFDSLSIVEAYLDQEGIAHFREEENVVCFDLPLGRTSYNCRVYQTGPILVLKAMWNGLVTVDATERAQRVLVRLSNIGTGSGNTYFNPARGALKFETSIDVNLTTLTAEMVGNILETLLDPFNVKIVAMQLVLERQLSEDAVIDAYKAWDQKRIARLMEPFRAGNGGDPSLN